MARMSLRLMEYTDIQTLLHGFFCVELKVLTLVPAPFLQDTSYNQTIEHFNKIYSYRMIYFKFSVDQKDAD